MPFLPELQSVNENFEQESNPIQEPLYIYLSDSVFLSSFTEYIFSILLKISFYIFNTFFWHCFRVLQMNFSCATKKIKIFLSDKDIK